MVEESPLGQQDIFGAVRGQAPGRAQSGSKGSDCSWVLDADLEGHDAQGSS